MKYKLELQTATSVRRGSCWRIDLNSFSLFAFHLTVLREAQRGIFQKLACNPGNQIGSYDFAVRAVGSIVQDAHFALGKLCADGRQFAGFGARHTSA